MKAWVTCLLASCVCVGVLRPVKANCGGLQGDVVFLLDASGSVGSSNFQTMLSFVSDLVDDFDIGADNVRVGVRAFASSPSIAFHLNTYYDKTSLKNAVMNVHYTGGGTYTANAINTMTSTMFSTSNGDRSNVPNVGIVITDGLSSSSSSTSSAAASARAAGITMFSIGIGTGVSELNAIATDPDSDHVFAVSSFSGLTSIESAFQTKACTTSVLAPVTCAQYTCHNGGQCNQVNAGAVPTCQCTSDYNGATCQNYIGAGAGAGAGATSSAAEESQSDNTAAIAGGVTAGVAALGLGVAGVAVYSKVMAGKTAVSTLQGTQQGNVESGQQNQNQQERQRQEDLEDNPIPGMIDAPAQVQPVDTRWPARLPPLNRY